MKSPDRDAADDILSLNELALALFGVQHAQAWWDKDRPKSVHRREELTKYDALNKKLSSIIDRYELPEGDDGERPDNGEDQLALIPASELATLRRRVAEMEPVVQAACGVVQADTYKHPILSRDEAVAAGVAAMHDAVNKYHVLTAHAALSSRSPPTRKE